MSTTLELAPITEVDPTLTIPCEHPDHETDSPWFHDGPGELYIKNLACPVCNTVPRGSFICCRKAYVIAGRGGLYCDFCGHPGPREEFWLLVREL